MIKLLINSNCNLYDLMSFDLIATGSNLYNYSETIIDHSNNDKMGIPINTKYNLIMPSNISKDDMYRYLDVLKFSKICLKSIIFSQDSFSLPGYLEHLKFIKSKEQINKEISFDTITKNDILILREYLKIGVNESSMYLYDIFDTVVEINGDSKIMVDNIDFCNLDEFTLDKAYELIDLSLSKEKRMTNQELFKKSVDSLDKDVSSIMYTNMAFLCSEKRLKIEDIINYKKNLIEFIEKNRDKRPKYLGDNHYAYTFINILHGEK